MRLLTVLLEAFACVVPLLATGAEPPGAAGNAPAAEPPVRNVILLIGDGMGPPQLGLLAAYARHRAAADGPVAVPAIEALMNAGVVGLMRTDPYGALVTDSAAAATQLATGAMSSVEIIGADHEGRSQPTIVEIARDQGMATGLVTDTRITHATPAAFGSHQPRRLMENEIAVDLLENRIDVLLGGGLRNWTPSAVNDGESAAHAALLQTTGGVFPATSRRADNRNLLLEARRTHELVFDRYGLQRVTQTPVLGLFADSELDDALAERMAESEGTRMQPTLVEMTTKAIELLSQNERGFFLMVEGGQIDWAGHNNDAGTLLHELLQFDAAVRIVYDFAMNRDDTLVVVTGDHETGSFGFSYSGRPLPKPRRLDGPLFNGRPYKPNFNFAPPAILDRLAAQKKSFFNIFREFDRRPAEEKTAEQLVELVNANISFTIDLEDALAILRRGPNRSYVPGHRYVGSKTVPQITDFDAFYVFGENGRHNLLARAVADQQSVVWGTGTHTSTPVALGAFGPASGRFARFLHAADVGQHLIDLVEARSR